MAVSVLEWSQSNHIALQQHALDIYSQDMSYNKNTVIQLSFDLTKSCDDIHHNAIK